VKLLVAALMLISAPAWACPSCALRGAAGPGTFALLAGMIAVPYAVAVIALKVIRKLDREP
jgi:hypothetical protein